MRGFAQMFEQWSNDWAYIFVLLATLGMAVAATGILAFPVWVLADLLEADAFPEDSVFWGAAAWVVSFALFGPRLVRLCRPVLEGFGRQENQ